MSTFKNVGFTSQSDWNTEAETSTKAPKSLVEQVAPTSKGRAMQGHAERVRDEVDGVTEREYEMTESPERQAIAALFESKTGALKVNPDGTFAVNQETDKNTLLAIKEALLDIRLDAENRETMRGLIGKVDEAVAQREVAETPQNIAKALAKLKELRGEVKRVAGRIKEVQASNMDYRTRRETLDQLFKALQPLNEELIREAIAVLDGLEKIRNTDPNNMLELVEQYKSSDKSIVNPYKSALIQFAGTHKLEFSGESKSGLEYSAKKDERYEEQREGRKSFSQVLVATTNAPKEHDDPYTFLREMTGIPEVRFHAIIEKALKS